jgi:hypothetical protein
MLVGIHGDDGGQQGVFAQNPQVHVRPPIDLAHQTLGGQSQVKLDISPPVLFELVSADIQQARLWDECYHGHCQQNLVKDFQREPGFLLRHTLISPLS